MTELSGGTVSHKLGTLLCLFFAFFTSIYYWSPLLEAKWSMADDHDIFTFIGQREHLPLAEIPTIMMNRSEVGLMGANQRFRPAYFALHLLQASAFGKNPAAWYAVRIGIALLIALVLASIGLDIVPPVVILGFLSYELSRPYWADIFARLGDGEAYAALGVSLCAIGVMLGLRKQFSSAVCAAVAVGVVIAAGSKENFLLLAAVPIWILTRRASILTVSGTLWLMGAIVSSIVIAVVVFVGVYHAGHDYYYHPLSPQNTWRVLTQVFQQIEVWIWILTSVVLWLFIQFGTEKGLLDSAVSRTLKQYVTAVLVLLVIYVAQAVFYSGQDVIDGGGRYQFPQLLARDIAILIASIIITRLVLANGGGAGSGTAISLVTAVCFAVASSAGWDSNRVSAQKTVRESNEFTQKLSAGMAFLKERPDTVLILNSYSEEDVEPVWSITEFMRASGISNAIVVKTNNYSYRSLRTDPNPRRAVLAAELEDIQAKGRVGRFAPLNAITNTVACYSYGLHGPPTTKCEAGDTIWPPGRSLNPSSYEGNVLSFVQGGNGDDYLVSGWSQAEPWGVWSDGRTATIVLRDASLADRANAELVIVARGYTNQDKPTQHVRVHLNDVDAGELLLGSKFTSTTLLVPAEALKSTPLQIELVPENPMSPATISTSRDRRLLGILLKSLQVREVWSY